MTATLTGPVYEADGTTPMAGALVKVKLIAGGPRTPGHANGSAIASEWSDTTDDNGDFSVTVPVIDTNVYPDSAYYEVHVGGGRYPQTLVKVQPVIDGTWVYTDPDIRGETLLPPEFVQLIPGVTLADVSALVDQYHIDNPTDVTDEVAAALLADPPLLVANALSELVGNEANARLSIGAASDSDVSALITALTARVAALELFINTTVFVTAEGVTSAVLTVPGGVVTFEIT